LNPGDRLRLKEVAALVAGRIGGKDEPYREVEDRVRKRINYAIEHGKLKRESDGMFIAKNFGQWARNVWPGKFDDLPIIATAAGAITSGSDTCGIAIAMPMTLEAAHAVITEQVRVIASLQTQIRELEKTVSHLRPDAELKARQRQTNRASALLPCKGR
jgi:hypothetical protein